jgi:hypothetical protein
MPQFARLRVTLCGSHRPNTLGGLVERRAEIAGQISHTRATLRQLIIDLDHIDAAIRISIQVTTLRAFARSSRARLTVRNAAT